MRIGSKLVPYAPGRSILPLLAAVERAARSGDPAAPAADLSRSLVEVLAEIDPPPMRAAARVPS